MKTQTTALTRFRCGLILITIAGLVTACGTNSIQTEPVVTQGLTQGPATTFTSSSSSSGGEVVSTNNGVPPLSMRVGTYGYNAATVTVSTQSVLKVQFQPGMQDQTTQGTNFEPQYSMLGVYITVGSLTQPTEVVTNGYANTTAGTSSILDFSSAIPAGNKGSITIVVAQPNYDFDCLNYQLYCYPVPWMHVVDSHPWHGTLLVQTDTTDAIQ